MSLRRTGLGWRSLSRLPAAAAQPQLAVHDVDARLTAIAQLSGPGSVAARREAAEALFGRATAAEQRFVVNLLTGQLRHGALDSAMLDAIAAAFEVPLVEVRRAAMLGGSPAAAAYAAAAGGEAALARIAMRVGTGVRPMLAASAPTVAEAVAAIPGPVSVDVKLDGIRVQVHRSGSSVTVFSRSLDDITDRVPDVVAAAHSIDAESFILDGEALVVGEDGSAAAFQDSAARLSRQSGAAPDATGNVVTVFFDILHLNGTDLIDRPARVRFAALQIVPQRYRIRRVLDADPATAGGFAAEALAAGHEAVVEIAIDGVQRSTRYPGGVALRFARVLRYRDDRPVAQITTIEELRERLKS